MSDFKGHSNLRDIFLTSVREAPNKPFLGTRSKHINDKVKELTKENEIVHGDYEWKTFQEIHDMSSKLARYLITHNLAPRHETEDGPFRFLALYSKDREEWAVTDLACILAGITTVTLYDTLGKESIEYILDQTSMKTVVC